LPPGRQYRQRRRPDQGRRQHCRGELRLHLARRINDPEREAQTVPLPAELVVREASGAPAAN
jgi:hypothetical protein